MSFLRIFRTPNPHKFDYRPRHWNPKKEEMEERLKEIERIKSGDPDSMKSRISSGLRRGGGSYKYANARSKQVSRSNWLLLIIILMLAFISYLLIYVYSPEIINMLN